MTTIRRGKSFKFICDTCETEEYEPEKGEEFLEAVEAMKLAGWKIFLEGDWNHKCPSCFENEQRMNSRGRYWPSDVPNGGFQ